MAQLKIKRGLAANLPTLTEGEPAFTTDEKKVYIGSADGNVQLAMLSDVSSIDHDSLSNRDAPDQHPIGAITKLKDTLDTKPDETLENEDIQAIIDGYYDPSGGDTSGDEPQIVVDPSLSSSSPNPVQNKAIYAALAKKEDTGTAAELINGHDASPNAHEDIRTALAEKLTQADLQSRIDEALSEIDLSVYAEKTELEDYLPLKGGTCTGGITAPNFQTGTDESAYFQTKKMRGQGAASTYKHAVDWGYSGHNQVDFYEYGGTWNFWQCKNTKTDAVFIGSITPTGWNGSAALTGTPTAPTAAEGTDSTQIATTAFVQAAIQKALKDAGVI